MIALSIHLPDYLAQESKEAAAQLGLSRTEFIRQAISHELNNFKARMELEAMGKSFSAMKKHKGYLQESKKIEGFLDTDLPDEEDNWWEKK